MYPFLKGKSSGDINKGITGEGHLVLAMLSRLVLDGTSKIGGLLVSPETVSYTLYFFD